MKETRYSIEDAQTEADKIRSILGPEASAEDYELAHQIIEDERGNNSKEWLEHFNKGYITIFPASGDKNIMIGINTTDKTTFSLFNIASREVTKQYKGFHQLGSNNSIGETAWELWGLPESVHPTEVIEEIYLKMLDLEDQFKKQGLLDIL